MYIDNISKKSQEILLSSDQKKALGIVLTGNFLEYFDLMLFSHLAFVVTPYFMPKTDPTVAKMLAIFAFSSSFVIRPLAAYFWGYIGDNFGRVVVLSHTTMLMAISCLLIANIPPFSECGYYSTLMIIGCRVFQGFSSAGEAKGAEIFVAEVVPQKPKIFLASAMVPITCNLGGLLATLLGSLCLSISPQEGWKICFYIGAAIAFSSSIARRKLKETKEFLNYKNSKKQPPKIWEKHFEKRNFLALMGLNMICPTAFYFAYSYGSDLLKDIGLKPNLILFNNSILLAIEITFIWFSARLAYRFNPFSILKTRTMVSFGLIPLCVMLVRFLPSHLTIFLAQLVVLLSTASFDPATPLIIKSFNIQSRFSRYSKAWAFAKAFMYLSTGFLTFWFDRVFGIGGVLLLLMTFSGIFLISLYAFVPFDQMKIKYIQQFLAEDDDEREKLLREEEVEDCSVPNSYPLLKKWVNNQA